MKHRLINFLYNLDRAVASLLGFPPQETLSSEIARSASTSPSAELAADALDKLQKDHVEKALQHAAKLDAADDGQEQ